MRSLQRLGSLTGRSNRPVPEASTASAESRVDEAAFWDNQSHDAEASEWLEMLETEPAGPTPSNAAAEADADADADAVADVPDLDWNVEEPDTRFTPVDVADVFPDPVAEVPGVVEPAAVELAPEPVAEVVSEPAAAGTVVDDPAPIGPPALAVVQEPRTPVRPTRSLFATAAEVKPAEPAGHPVPETRTPLTVVPEPAGIVRVPEPEAEPEPASEPFPAPAPAVAESLNSFFDAVSDDLLPGR